MSQGIHLLYNSEIEGLYRQNTASVLSRLHEMALENPQAGALEIISEAVALYGVDEPLAEETYPEVADEVGEDYPFEPQPVEDTEVVDGESDVDEEGAPEAVFESDEDENHADIASAWTEDEEDEALLRDDPEAEVESPVVEPEPEPELEPEPDPEPEPEEEEEEVYDGPRFALNSWGLPERIDDGDEVEAEERGPRRVVLEGIDE